MTDSIYPEKEFKTFCICPECGEKISIIVPPTPEEDQVKLVCYCGFCSSPIEIKRYTGGEWVIKSKKHNPEIKYYGDHFLGNFTEEIECPHCNEQAIVNIPPVPNSQEHITSESTCKFCGKKILIKRFKDETTEIVKEKVALMK